MIKLKSIIFEISQQEYEQYRNSDEYKQWRKDWFERYKATFDDKGRLIAYNGTTPTKARSIKEIGFKVRSHFSLNKNYSRKYGIVVLKVHLPLDSIDIVGPDLISIRPIKWEEVI